MNTAMQTGALNTPTLRNEIKALDAKIVAIQRSKDHHKQRGLLSELQRDLHNMRVELKTREDAEKRARWSHAVTPTASV
jgi:hypothetical protein